MLRSMFTAISSLTLHQSYMDIIADNLANANTPGYKSSSVSFQDELAQLLQAGTPPTQHLGGVNPTQIGLGVRMGSVIKNFNQGTLQSTGRSLDLSIQGDGFFVYDDAKGRYYSRAGSLEMDADGVLVNSSTGHRIMGWAPDANDEIDTTGPLGYLSIPLDSNLAKATENVVLGGNMDATSASGSAGAYDISFGINDSLGALQSVTVTLTKTSDNNWDWAATSGATGSGTLVFDSEGQYVSGGGTLTAPAVDGATDTVFDVDMTGLTQLSSYNSASSVSQDGLEAGALSGFDVISNTGELWGLYSNGLQRRIGAMALSTFSNPSGLIRVGQGFYRTGLNSGDPDMGVASSGSRGTVMSGFLEASNVNMAQEFTNMILAQRGFQASSRVISTSDEMLQELVNLRR
jgi:flagellar hook protein FlgE